MLASRRAGAIFYGRNRPDETSGHSKLVVFGFAFRVATHTSLHVGVTTRGCIQLGEDILRNDFDSSLIRI